jgi:hypothetical protein
MHTLIHLVLTALLIFSMIGTFRLGFQHGVDNTLLELEKHRDQEYIMEFAKEARG